jgi:cell wall-associated protease
MMLRAVPDGDEHDKDIALAIRYAVDNGAKVINMSFGKYFSPQKQWVDDAVAYAESKGVLLVAAAGNEGFLVDTLPHFPNPILVNKRKVGNWIMVGASGDPSNGGLVASFSNYGKNEVDVFSPGVNIYSTVPGGNTYGSLSGTSMASPVVAGVAALLMSYYPTLTAQQVKYVIEKSAVVPDKKASIAGSDKEVSLAEISRTGGIVNAAAAIKLAESMTKKPAPKIKVKSPKKS